MEDGTSIRRRLNTQKEVLKWLEDFSEKLQKRAHDASCEVHRLLEQATVAEQELKAAFNSFRSLSNVQFIENTMQEEDEITSHRSKAPQSSTEASIRAQSYEADIMPRYKEALSLGLSSYKQHLQSRKSSAASVYKFGSARGELPHIIGSEEFMHDNTCGLTEDLILETTTLGFSHKSSPEQLRLGAGAGVQAMLNPGFFGIDQDATDKDVSEPLVSAPLDFKAMLEAALISPYRIYDEDSSSQPSVGGDHYYNPELMHEKGHGSSAPPSTTTVDHQRLTGFPDTNASIAQSNLAFLQDSNFGQHSLPHVLVSGSLFDSDEESISTSQMHAGQSCGDEHVDVENLGRNQITATLTGTALSLGDAHGIRSIRDGGEQNPIGESFLDESPFGKQEALGNFLSERRDENTEAVTSPATGLSIQEGYEVHDLIKSSNDGNSVADTHIAVTDSEVLCVPSKVNNSFGQVSGSDDSHLVTNEVEVRGTRPCNSDQLTEQISERERLSREFVFQDIQKLNDQFVLPDDAQRDVAYDLSDKQVNPDRLMGGRLSLSQKGLCDNTDDDDDDDGPNDNLLSKDNSSFQWESLTQIGTKVSVAEILHISTSDKISSSTSNSGEKILSNFAASNELSEPTGGSVGELETREVDTLSASHTSSYSEISSTGHPKKLSFLCSSVNKSQTNSRLNDLPQRVETTFSTVVSVSQEPVSLFSPTPLGGNHGLDCQTISCSDETCIHSSGNESFVNENYNRGPSEMEPEARTLVNQSLDVVLPYSISEGSQEVSEKSGTCSSEKRTIHASNATNSLLVVRLGSNVYLEA
ncbi:hypothetical protein AMTR_s00003p00268540 [Amborella trichopoda]|uniref:Uncharacterized protein n=1 Tax=Amborella trichopoda TaxID=13333 RepID=W1P0V9_AMBTC|nr:hypothetical protein AMTR_s00003p00268540 [Amborella trichopoda]